jgi:hypothetical protein
MIKRITNGAIIRISKTIAKSKNEMAKSIKIKYIIADIRMNTVGD